MSDEREPGGTAEPEWKHWFVNVDLGLDAADRNEIGVRLREVIGDAFGSFAWSATELVNHVPQPGRGEVS